MNKPPAMPPIPVADAIRPHSLAPFGRDANSTGPSTKKGAKATRFSRPYWAVTSWSQRCCRNSCHPSFRSVMNEADGADSCAGMRISDRQVALRA